MNPSKSVANRINTDRANVARVVHAALRCAFKIGCECRDPSTDVLHFSVHIQNKGASLLMEGIQDAMHRFQFKDNLSIPSTIYVNIPPHHYKSTAYGSFLCKHLGFDETQIEHIDIETEYIVLDGYPKTSTPLKPLAYEPDEDYPQNPHESNYHPQIPTPDPNHEGSWV